MRTVTPRSLYQTVPAEVAALVVSGEIIGTFTPVAVAPPDELVPGPAAVEPVSAGPIRGATVAPVAGPVDDLERRRRAQAERDRLLRRMQTH